MTSRLYGECTRVDVLFDQYQDNSIKSEARAKRQTTVRQARTNITSRDATLLFSRLIFIEMNENKSNLEQFLLYELVKVVCFEDHRIIVDERKIRGMHVLGVCDK